MKTHAALAIQPPNHALFLQWCIFAQAKSLLDYKNDMESAIVRLRCKKVPGGTIKMRAFPAHQKRLVISQANTGGNRDVDRTLASAATAHVTTDEALVERLIDAVSDCVPVAGNQEFTELFLKIVRLTGAGQVAAFAYQPEQVSCLLTRNFMSEDKGGTLAATYMDGWFRDDPLFQQAMEMVQDDCVVQQLEDLLPGIGAQYLKTFFGAPGFRTKISVLVSQDSFRMVMNLYFESGVKDPACLLPDRVGYAIYRLIGKTLSTHFLRLSLPDFPVPLTVLSERERQVCVGMLAGKKAEIIAEEMGIGPSSVVTYRQRAYQKLGISSRGQLFSICQFRPPEGSRPTETMHFPGRTAMPHSRQKAAGRSGMGSNVFSLAKIIRGERRAACGARDTDIPLARRRGFQ